MMPRSVPPIPKRVMVLFRLPAPVTNSMKLVLVLRTTGLRVVPGYVVVVVAAAASSLIVNAATGWVDRVFESALICCMYSRRAPRASSAIANGDRTGPSGRSDAEGPMPRLENRLTRARCTTPRRGGMDSDD